MPERHHEKQQDQNSEIGKKRDGRQDEDRVGRLTSKCRRRTMRSTLRLSWSGRSEIFWAKLVVKSDFKRF
jgi:hypothetical protein